MDDAGLTATAVVLSSEASQAHEPPFAYADAPNRMVAYALDAILLTVLVLAVSIVISIAFGPVVEFDSDGSTPIELNRGLALLDVLAATAFSLAYFVCSWRWLLGTPGQRALRMRLTSEDGTPLTLARSIVRWLSLGLPLGLAGILVVVLPGFGDLIADLAVLACYAVLLATIARSPTKQGWHDRLASSIVVKPVRMADRDR